MTDGIGDDYVEVSSDINLNIAEFEKIFADCADVRKNVFFLGKDFDVKVLSHMLKLRFLMFQLQIR